MKVISCPIKTLIFHDIKSQCLLLVSKLTSYHFCLHCTLWERGHWIISFLSIIGDSCSKYNHSFSLERWFWDNTNFSGIYLFKNKWCLWVFCLFCFLLFTAIAFYRNILFPIHLTQLFWLWWLFMSFHMVLSIAH